MERIKLTLDKDLLGTNIPVTFFERDKEYDDLKKKKLLFVRLYSPQFIDNSVQSVDLVIDETTLKASKNADNHYIELNLTTSDLTLKAISTICANSKDKLTELTIELFVENKDKWLIINIADGEFKGSYTFGNFDSAIDYFYGKKDATVNFWLDEFAMNKYCSVLKFNEIEDGFVESIGNFYFQEKNFALA